MHYQSAIGVSTVSALLYHVSYRGFICLKIDDAVNAGAVHFACGFWGLLAAGWTVTAAARADLGYPDEESCTREAQIGTNALMAFTIFAWVRVFRRRAELLAEKYTEVPYFKMYQYKVPALIRFFFVPRSCYERRPDFPAVFTLSLWCLVDFFVFLNGRHI